MNQPINKYSDLCEERERVKNLIVIQKQRIHEDWENLKAEFVPVKNVFGVVGKMTHADKTNPIINLGLKVASDLFLKNFVLGKAGWVAKLAVPFVVKNYSSHMLARRGGNFLGKVANLFAKKKPGATGVYRHKPTNPDFTPGANAGPV